MIITTDSKVIEEMAVETKGHVCPVCGKYIFEHKASYDICDVCGWEDDEVQNADHDYRGGANELSVNDSRLLYFLLSDEATADEALGMFNSYKAEKRDLKTKYVKFEELDRSSLAGQIKELTESFVNGLKGLYDSIENSEMDE